MASLDETLSLLRKVERGPWTAQERKEERKKEMRKRCLETIPLPTTKEEFLNKIDSMTYDQRIQYASKLGHFHKGTSEFDKLIEQLLYLPFTDQLPYEVAEGCPEHAPQTTAVAKHFTQYQIALNALAATKRLGLAKLKQELFSPTSIMKTFLVHEVVRLETNDDELIKVIFSVAPFLRRKIVHASIATGNRQTLLDRILPEVETKFGISEAADLLHGCSSSVVKAKLGLKSFLASKSLSWKSIIRYHGLELLSLMRSEFERQTPKTLKKLVSGRLSIWKQWATRFKSWCQFMDNPNYAKELLQLWLDYPNLTITVQTEEIPSLDKLFLFVSRATPLFNWSLFKTNWSLVFNTLKSEICINASGNISYYIPSYDRGTGKKVPFSLAFEFLETGLDLIQPENLMSGKHNINSLLHMHDIFDFQSIDQIIQLIKLWVRFCVRTRPDKDELFRSWRTQFRVSSVVSCALARLLPIQSEMLKGKKSDNGLIENKKDFTKLRTAAELLLNDLTLPFVNFRRCEHDGYGGYTDEYKMKEDLQKYLLLWPDLLQKDASSFEAEFHTKASKTIDLIRFIKSGFVDVNHPRYPPGYKEEANAAIRSITHELISKTSNKQIYTKEILNDSRLPSLFQALPSELRLEFFNLINETQLKEWANSDIDAFLRTLKGIPKERASEVVTLFFAEGVTKKSVRDQLLPYVDVSDNKMRNALQKATDSNSIADRDTAIITLLKATRRAGSIIQTTRTLKFLRLKLKNESAERRAAKLQDILSENRDKESWLDSGRRSSSYSNRNFQETLLPNGITAEQLDVWYQMLQDALESPDLDEESRSAEFTYHPILQHFSSISSTAIWAAVTYAKDEAEVALLFEFGVEIQWRVILYRKGLKRAAQEFKINLPAKEIRNELKKNNDRVLHLANLYLESYRSRITTHQPDWESQWSYLEDLFEIAGKSWQSIPSLTNFFRQTVNSVQGEDSKIPKDEDGLWILESDHPVVELFTHLKKFYPNPSSKKPVPEGFLTWDSIEENVTLFNILAHSRQLPRILTLWLTTVQNRAATRQGKFAERTALVCKLLELTPSAIYVKFVWRHLLSRRQDLLNTFINAKASFRGVFFVEHSQRDSANITTSNRRERRGFGRRPKTIKGHKKSRPLSALANSYEVELEREAEMENDLSPEGDHIDIFCLEACYGLHRLLPRQMAGLAKQREIQITNNDRSVQERMRSVRRFTLLPYVNYVDIIRYLEKHQGLPTSVNDSLVRGMMNNDEPRATLNYLFSPAFLSSSQARISIYAASKAVPWCTPGSLARTFDVVLTKNRNDVKITIHKEMIRLLLLIPQEDNINLVVKEWNRRDLHRDVRITILEGAFILLANPNELFVNAAWRIIELATTQIGNTEVLLALLGIGGAVARKDLFQRPRLAEFLGGLKEVKIGAQHAERYARNVVLKLASYPPFPITPSTPPTPVGEKKEKAPQLDDDVRHLAVASLAVWIKRASIANVAATLFFNTATDYFNKLMSPETKEFDRKLNVLRWFSSVGGLFSACGVYSRRRELNFAPVSLLIQVIDQVCSSLADPVLNKDPAVRARLWPIVDWCFFQLPSDREALDEEQLLAPFSKLDGHMDEQFLQRRVDTLKGLEADYFNKASKIIEDTLARILSRGQGFDTAVSTITRIVNIAIMKDGRTLLNHLIANKIGTETQRKDSKFASIRFKSIFGILQGGCWTFDPQKDDIEVLINFLREAVEAPRKDIEPNQHTVAKVVGAILNKLHPQFKTAAHLELREEGRQLIQFITLLPFDDHFSIKRRRKIKVVASLFEREYAYFVGASSLICSLVSLFLTEKTISTGSMVAGLSSYFERSPDHIRVAFTNNLLMMNLETSDPLPGSHLVLPDEVTIPKRVEQALASSYEEGIRRRGQEKFTRSLEARYIKAGWCLLTRTQPAEVLLPEAFPSFLNWTLIASLTGVLKSTSTSWNYQSDSLPIAPLTVRLGVNLLDSLEGMVSGDYIRNHPHPRQNPDFQMSQLKILYDTLILDHIANNLLVLSSKEPDQHLERTWRIIEELRHHEDSTIRARASRFTLR